MLCLVADDYREEQTEKIGRVIARRLNAAAKAMRLTQGQVFVLCNQGLPPDQEIISEATVSAVMGGRVNNPGIGTVLILTQALGLSLDQAVGLTPMPESAPVPAEDDLAGIEERMGLRLQSGLEAMESRLDQRLQDGLEKGQKALGEALKEIQQYFDDAAKADREAALAAQREQLSKPPEQTDDRPQGKRGKAK